MIARAIFLAAIILLAACKDKPTQPPPSPNISGTWKGSGSKSGIAYTVTANLTQADGGTDVTGSGEISALLTSITFSVSGYNHYPDIGLTFSNPNPQIGNGTYIGKFSKNDNNTIDGSATVPSFGIVGELLQMKRTN